MKTRYQLIRVLSLLALIAAWTCSWARPGAAQVNPKLDAFAQINRARLTNGLAPFASSPLLEKAAQRHSDDMARNNFLGDAGSDDSNAKDRMTQAGYTAWSNDKVIWGENLYADIGDFSAVLNFILSDPSQARILLNPRYREVGLGVAVGESGKSYWTLLYGAQPNVLPIFINDGASVTNNATVALRLSQEDAVQSGESNVIGRVIDVRIGNNPAGTGASWQQWQPLLEYKFDTVPGIKTIYVQYRDGAGRVANAAASIRYDPNASSLDTIQSLGPGDIVPNATPTVIVTLTPEPTLTRVPSVNTDPTSATSAEGTPTAVVIGGPLLSEPTGTPQPAQPAPVAQPTQTAPASLERIPTAFVIEFAATNAALSEGPANATAAAEPLVATLSAPQVNATPVLVPSNTLARVDVPLPAWLLPAYLVAQTAVIVLGLYAFFKRK